MDGLTAGIDALVRDLNRLNTTETPIAVTIADTNADLLAVTLTIPGHNPVTGHLPAHTDLIDEDQTTSTAPMVAATLAENIQSDIMEFVVGGAWPRCPIHGRHPLEVVGTKWACPAGSGTWPIGELPATSADEPRVEDNTVRWWSENHGWGVVAHHDGDIFVLFSMLAGPGYRSLHEGDQVEVSLADRMQGRLRAAHHVRLAGPQSRR